MIDATTVLRRAALAAAAAFALIAPAAGAHTTDPLGPKLQGILDRAVRASDATYPGVALYVHRAGHPAWAGAAGVANVSSGRPMRPGDRFRAGSIMKPLVAAATLQLVEAGKFALDDPLPAVLPARVTARFPEADHITVRMLLDHTSGIAEYSDDAFDGEVLADPRRRWTVDELLDRAAALPRTGAPGERFAYSNADYNLLGLVLEQATGRPWRAVVRRRVIDRLHLRHTSLPASGRVVGGRDIAHGYELVGGKLVDVSDVDSSMAGAAGGNALLTNAHDLTRFVHALATGRLFRHARTTRELLTFVAAQGEGGLVGYGLGLERYALPDGTEVIGHMGTGAGYRAFMFRLPAQHVDLTLVTNQPGDPARTLFPVLDRLRDR